MKRTGDKVGLYSLSIVLAGSLWGLIGLFSRAMYALGIDSFGLVLLRCGLGAVLFGANLLLSDRGGFRVRLKDAWVFFGSGILSMLFFNVCYFQAISLMSMSAAAILLYTAPCFVILLSAPLFGERITAVKLAALLLAMVGCALTSGVTDMGAGEISLTGVLYGLGAGFGYALYSIFGKLAFRRGYGNLTLNFYTCLFAALGAGLLWGFRQPVEIAFSSGSNFLLFLVVGLFTFYVPYLLYAYGLSHTEAGKASVMASVEPVVATAAGFIAFNERPTLWSAVGILLVLSAIFLLNSKRAGHRV